MTGLDKITGKIISEAKKDADGIIAEASKRCSEIMFEAGKDADKIRAELEEKAQKSAENIIARAKSSAAMQKRGALLAAKSRAVDKAFDTAYSEIMHLPEEKYCELLSKLTAEAFLSELDAERTNISLYGEENVETPERYEIVFSKNDREKYGKIVLEGVGRIVIGKESRDTVAKLVISKKTADIDGGIILVCGDIEINCSLSSVFSQVRERLEPEISALLFDDKE